MDQPVPAPSPEDVPPNLPPEVSLSVPPDEGLPEEEPLSPEILEDEAIRGDFVLRWVVVALAVLLGCAQLNDALPLVHVRTGEWLAVNGFFPTGFDPFSLITADRTWVNLSWLFDLLAAGVNSVGGGIGLSLCAGLLAAITFALIVHAHRPEIRTWWTAVCGALALLVAYDRFDFAPAAITLLGVAAVLSILIRSENTGRFGSLWCLVPLLWLWAQMSSQAWIGGAMVIAYLLGAMFHRPSIEVPAGASIPARTLLAPGLISVLVMLLHPFTWRTWGAVWTQYAVELPAFRQLYPRPVVVDLVWYPLWSPLVWEQWNHRLVAGLVLMAVAGLCLLLNRKRVSWSHLFLYLGANALGAAALHDLSIASLINAVLASIHAQEWYRERFGQIYAVAPAEIFFSRGGRAVTLFAFFGLAWTIVSGRIDGPDGRRTGVGLSRALAVELQTYRELGIHTRDDRGFHTTVRQGDFLIAAGRKSLVDRRVTLFTGEGDANLLAWYEQMRRGFLPAVIREDAIVQPQLRREAIEKYELSHVIVRLLVPRDYSSLPTMLSTTDVSLSALLPTAAVFQWVKPRDPVALQFANDHAFNAVQAAFRPESPALDDPVLRPTLPAWTQQLVSLPREQRTPSTALAQHFLRLGRFARNAPLPFQVGCFHLAIRSARAGIREDALQPEPYVALGEAYLALSQLEAMILSGNGVPWTRSLRYYEAIAALQQAVRLRPDAPEAYGFLVDVYQQAGQVDVALAALKQVLKVTQLPPDATDEVRLNREALFDLELRLEGAVEKIAKEVNRRREQEPDRVSVAAFAYQSGALQMAVDMLQEDAVELERNPVARQLLTLWLAELGEGDALDESSSRLEAVSGQFPTWTWRNGVGYAALSRGDYNEAVKAWQRVAHDMDRLGLESLLETTPLAQASTVFLGDFQYPVAHLTATQHALQRIPYEGLEALLPTAFCEMERGNTPAAISAIRAAIQRAPDSPMRPLLRVYLFCLTDELIDPEPPADWIPQPADLFAPES